MRWRKYGAAAAAMTMLAGTALGDCRDPQNQHEMNRCASESYAAADAALNATYAQLMRAMGDKTMRDRLRDAQRAWIRFRDSQCAFDAAENEGGSMYPLVHAGCLARQTKARQRQLQSTLACMKNNSSCEE